jgi:hypothetical protein
MDTPLDNLTEQIEGATIPDSERDLLIGKFKSAILGSSKNGHNLRSEEHTSELQSPLAP